MKTRMLALLTVLGLVVAACGGSTESPSASVDAGKGDYKACLALDVGGIGDKSFNDSAYEGLLEAEAAVLQAVDLPLHQRDLRRNVVVVARLKNRKRME